ncbi:MAG: alpha/beta hydrolase [Rhodanobacteraceae bacterium]
MAGTVILSHGFESGPEATKTSAMAAAAERQGWTALRPDYREHDAHGLGPAVEPRCRQLQALCDDVDAPLVLAGSSMGSFVSGLVSREVDCIGLFLLAVPVMMPDFEKPFDLRAGVPTTLVHGYADDRCPAHTVWDLARQRGLDLMMVADGHRLADHVDWIAAQFALFLQRIGQPG